MEMIDFAILLFSVSSPVLHSEFFFPWSIKLSLHGRSQAFETSGRNHTDTWYFYSQMLHKQIKKEASTGGFSCVSGHECRGCLSLSGSETAH